MADVDCLRDHAWVYRLRGIYEFDTSDNPGLQLAIHARVYCNSVSRDEYFCWLVSFWSPSAKMIYLRPFFVCIMVYICPESPRWYMIRNRYQEAHDALCKLRPSSIQAARDLYYIHSALKVEEKLREGKQLWREMLTVPRNRRAAQSSFFVMFMQQVS